jgi:hypothetical protein
MLKSILQSRTGAAALVLLVLLAATLGCYHRLLIVADGGSFRYLAVRWGLHDFMYPRLIFNSDSLRQGVFPLWNPYPFGGCPWVSNFQSGLFHPLHLAIILLSGYSAAALQIELVLIFFIAGVSMYFCARGLAVSRPAALLAAISFTGCGFFVGNASYLPQIITLAHFPLVFLAAVKISERPTLLRITGGGLAIALMIFAGYPSMAFFMLLSGLGFGAINLAFIDRPPRRGLLRKAAGLLGWLSAGLGLAAILLLPAGESYPHIVRPDRSDEFRLALPRETVLKKSLSPGQTLSLAFPFLGSTNLSPYHLWPEFRNCSIGLVGLFFAAYSLLRRRDRTRTALAFLAGLFLALSWGFNTPLYSFLYPRFIALQMVSHPAMDFRAIFLFLLCLLAGRGLDHYDHAQGNWRTGIWTLASAGFAWGAWRIFSGDRLPVPAEAATGEPAWWAIVGVLAALTAGRQLLRGLLLPALLALAVIDGSYWANHNFSTVAAPAGKGEWKRIAKKEQARNRSVIATELTPREQEYPRPRQSRAMFWKYFSDSGTDSARLKDFQDLMDTPARSILHRNFRLHPFDSVRILDRPEQVWAELPGETDPLRTARIAREDLSSPGLLRRLESLSKPGSRPTGFRGRVAFFSPNRIEYEIDLEQPAALLFNEIYYPGWSLEDGGQSAPLFRINGAFRGTCLEAGKHRLTMRFRPNSFRWGARLSALTALSSLAALLAGYARRFYSRPTASPSAARNQTSIPDAE